MSRELPDELQRLVARWWDSDQYSDAKAAAIWNERQPPERIVTATAIGEWRRDHGYKRSGMVRARAAAIANGAGACPTPKEIRRECDKLEAGWTRKERKLHTVQPVKRVEIIEVHG